MKLFQFNSKYYYFFYFIWRKNKLYFSYAQLMFSPPVKLIRVPEGGFCYT